MIIIIMVRATHLQGQQAFVDLCSLHAGLPVGARCVGASFVPREVYEGELSVHLPLPSEDDLEHGVATR